VRQLNDLRSIAGEQESSRRPPPLFRATARPCRSRSRHSEATAGIDESSPALQCWVSVFQHVRPGRDDRVWLPPAKEWADELSFDRPCRDGSSFSDIDPAINCWATLFRSPLSLWRGLDRHGRAVARRAEAASGTGKPRVFSSRAIMLTQMRRRGTAESRIGSHWTS
jgi:hypothetical protein